ncbi:MAG: nuclease [Pelagibacterales bacterium]|nr:nuclease [Pelagibacterales bacterium]
MVEGFHYHSIFIVIKLINIFKYINLLLILYSMFFASKIIAKEEIISYTNITVIDGDTVKFNNKKIRLHGIDTPEIKQLCKNTKNENYKCGVKAKLALINLINNNKIKCLIHGKDKYKRLIGTCFIKNLNINAWLVKNGWALAYRKYSKDYINQEIWAKKNLMGLWQGEFLEPWKWRRK